MRESIEKVKDNIIIESVVGETVSLKTTLSFFKKLSNARF
jgi:DNA primase